VQGHLPRTKKPTSWTKNLRRTGRYKKLRRQASKFRGLARLLRRARQVSRKAGPNKKGMRDDTLGGSETLRLKKNQETD